MLTVQAPAKLNLTLEVLGERGDGFHEIRSVIQTISLCDSLSFQSNDRVEFRSDSPEWVAENSLVSKAVRLVKEVTGYSEGVAISVSKRIPLLSGLGGDSSDAATTLRGLNQLWGLGLPKEQLLGLAQQLGSDVAFFFYGGTALVEGRGEIVTTLPSLTHMWVILAMPPGPRLPGKTKELYESLRPSHYTDGRITGRLVEELKAGKEFDTSLLFNTFENVAFSHFSQLDVTRRHVVKMGANDVHLAGSGPALFTLLKEKVPAEGLYAQLRGQGVEPYLAETLAPIDQSG